MTQQLIAVDANALDQLISRVESLEKKLDAVRFAKEPRWISVAAAAEKYGKSHATIRRWKAEGRIECNNGLVLNPDA